MKTIGLLSATIVTACAVAISLANTADPLPPTMRSDAPAPLRGGECGESCSEPASLAIGSGQRVVADATHDDRPVAGGECAAARATADERLAAIVLALDAGDDGAEQVVALRDLLRERPDLAGTFTDAILASARSERARVRLLQAMQWVGDPACQASLAVIAAADPIPVSLRLSALRSLGDVTRPTAATLASLWSHAAAELPWARAAVIAFARAAGAAADTPHLHQQCCAQLRRELVHATTPDRVSVLLRCLASAHDPDVGDEAMRWLTSPEAAVRVVAVDLLLKIPGPRYELAVRDLLCTEADAEVRRIGFRGLSLRAS